MHVQREVSGHGPFSMTASACPITAYSIPGMAHHQAAIALSGKHGRFFPDSWNVVYRYVLAILRGQPPQAVTHPPSSVTGLFCRQFMLFFLSLPLG